MTSIMASIINILKSMAKNSSKVSMFIRPTVIEIDVGTTVGVVGTLLDGWVNFSVFRDPFGEIVHRCTVQHQSFWTPSLRCYVCPRPQELYRTLQ